MSRAAVRSRLERNRAKRLLCLGLVPDISVLAIDFILFYFILTLIWLVSHAELLDTCIFSQKTFEGIKTETWVRLGNYLEEYAVSGENKITEMIGFLVRVGVLS